MTEQAHIDAPTGGNRWRIIGWSIAAALIGTPMVAMQFTDEVNWGPEDFLFATGMIGGVGLLFELTVRAQASWAYRAGVALALAASFLLVWINLAVGILGNEDNPANLMFFILPLFAALGAAVTRFRPRGMAWTMTLTAAGQVIVLIAAWWMGFGVIAPITAFFATLWLLSAALFRQAAD